MKKIIDIPDEILEDLQILSVKAKKTLKTLFRTNLKNLSIMLNRSRLNIVVNVLQIGVVAITKNN